MQQLQSTKIIVNSRTNASVPKREIAQARFGHLNTIVLRELKEINKPAQLLIHHTEAALLHPIFFVGFQLESDKLQNRSQTM